MREREGGVERYSRAPAAAIAGAIASRSTSHHAAIRATNVSVRIGRANNRRIGKWRSASKVIANTTPPAVMIADRTSVTTTTRRRRTSNVGSRRPVSRRMMKRGSATQTGASASVCGTVMSHATSCRAV